MVVDGPCYIRGIDRFDPSKRPRDILQGSYEALTMPEGPSLFLAQATRSFCVLWLHRLSDPCDGEELPAPSMGTGSAARPAVVRQRHRTYSSLGYLDLFNPVHL